jgi:hypothetical protein
VTDHVVTAYHFSANLSEGAGSLGKRVVLMNAFEILLLG